MKMLLYFQTIWIREKQKVFNIINLWARDFFELEPVDEVVGRINYHLIKIESE